MKTATITGSRSTLGSTLHGSGKRWIGIYYRFTCMYYTVFNRLYFAYNHNNRSDDKDKDFVKHDPAKLIDRDVIWQSQFNNKGLIVECWIVVIIRSVLFSFCFGGGEGKRCCRPYNGQCSANFKCCELQTMLEMILLTWSIESNAS